MDAKDVEAANLYLAEIQHSNTSTAPITDTQRWQLRRKVVALTQLNQKAFSAPIAPGQITVMLAPLTLRVAFEAMVNDGKFGRTMLEQSLVWPTQTGDRQLRATCAAFRAAHAAYILDIAARLGTHLPRELARKIAWRLIEARLSTD